MAIVIDTAYKPTAEQAASLFASVGWGTRQKYCQEKWEKVLQGTHTIISVRLADTVIAMARFSTDRAHETHMHEIAVRPEYQRRGIGRRIMSYANEIFASTEIFLGAITENEGFFRACGYTPKEEMVVYARDRKHLAVY